MTELNPHQFGEYSLHYGQTFGDNPDHKISAVHKSGEEAGVLRWSSVPKGKKMPRGTITNVVVRSEHQRKGLATEMLKHAQSYSASAGLPEPRHSPDRSDKGEAWAKSVGGKLPHRKK